MKKTILAMTVAAAAVAPLAQADMTVSGDARYIVTNQDATGTTGTLETNLGLGGSVTSESGVTVKAYTELEFRGASSTVDSVTDIDDQYLSIGNGTATLTVGDFASKKAYADGVDTDFAVAPALVSGFKANAGDDVGDVEAAVDFKLGEASVQVAGNVYEGSADALRVYASMPVGEATVAVNYEDMADVAGYAASVSMPVGEAKVTASYGANSDTDANSMAASVSYEGLVASYSVHDNGTDTAGQYYAGYTVSNVFGLEGAAATVAVAGAEDADTRIGAKLGYKF